MCIRDRSFDTRFRINKGNWDLTFGAVGRLHPVYGVTPIDDFWVPGESTFQELAEDFGYTPEQWMQGFYIDQNWYDVSGGDSVLIATSNDEFFHHYFGDAVARFNERELEKLGLQNIIVMIILQSFVMGIFAMLLFSYAARFLGASETAAFGALIPIISLIGGVVLLNETVPAFKLAGIVLVSIGVFLASGLADKLKNKSVS